jgi:hypothetical protein
VLLHLVAVTHLCSGSGVSTEVRVQGPPEEPEHSQTNPKPKESLDTLTQEIFVLSQALATWPIAQLDVSLAVVEAYHLAKYTLTAVIASTQGTRALPEKEYISLHQKSWPETTEHMGI